MDRYSEIRMRVFAKLYRKRVLESAGIDGIGRDPLTGETVYTINHPTIGRGYPFPVANCINGQLLFD